MVNRSLRTPLSLLALISAVPLFSCSGNRGAPDAGVAANTIGPEGGTATGPNGASVFVPAGAVDQGKTVTITLAEDAHAPTPGNTTAVGKAYAIGPAGTKFLKPVTVILPLDMSQIPVGSSIADVAVYTSDEGAGADGYTSLPTIPLQGTSQVSASVDHFSRFIPAVAPFPVYDGGPGNGSSSTTGSTSGSTGATTGSSGSTSSSSSGTTTGSTGSSSSTSSGSSSSTSTTGSTSGSTTGSTGSTGSSSTGTTGTTTGGSSSGSSGSTGVGCANVSDTNCGALSVDCTLAGQTCDPTACACI